MLPDDFDPVVRCSIYCKEGKTGFMNRYCSKYIKEKPLEILFNGAKYIFFTGRNIDELDTLKGM